MSTEISYRDFRADLADVLNRIEYRNESFTITRRGSAVANVRPHTDSLEAIATGTGATREVVLSALDDLITRHGAEAVVVSEEDGTVTANAGVVLRAQLGKLPA